MDDVVSNLANIRDTIANLAVAAGRNPDDIKLIAVSKTYSVDVLQSAALAGQRAFGENTVQEALNKIAPLRDHNIEWHFIGHLQSNKARFIPNNFAWIHSLDSSKLGRRLSSLANAQHARLSALIEINVTGDANKHGIAPDELFPLLDELLKENLPAIALRGLMTIGPHPATEARIRAAFAFLRKLRDEAAARYALPNFTELSMGMSGDYAEAIREGSTMLRIGTAIFGARTYPTA